MVPKQGVAERRLVITVAAQKDICPQTKTYPMKAAPITSNMIKIPVAHVYLNIQDMQYIPRPA